MPEATIHSQAEGSCYAAVTVPSRVESIRLATTFIVEAARNMHVPPASDSLFEIAIVEAVTNALKHGNTLQRPDASIVCELEVVDHRLTVRILDEGPGFVLPRAARPEWRPDDIPLIPESGYGVQLIRGMFPMVRTIARPGASGLEMALTF